MPVAGGEFVFLDSHVKFRSHNVTVKMFGPGAEMPLLLVAQQDWELQQDSLFCKEQCLESHRRFLRQAEQLLRRETLAHCFPGWRNPESERSDA